SSSWCSPRCSFGCSANGCTTMPEVRRPNPAKTVGSVVLHVAVTLFAVLFLFPFFWMVSNAIRSNGEVLAVPPHLLPSDWEWGNFYDAWHDLPFGQFFVNSIFVALSVTVVTLAVSSLAGYAFARIRFFGRDGLFLVYLSTLRWPMVMIVIPLTYIMAQLCRVNSYPGQILLVANGSFVTIPTLHYF